MSRRDNSATSFGPALSARTSCERLAARGYLRNDFLEERRSLMSAWANQLNGNLAEEKVMRFERSSQKG
jgi:hypothetical protein